MNRLFFALLVLGFQSAAAPKRPKNCPERVADILASKIPAEPLTQIERQQIALGEREILAEINQTALRPVDSLEALQKTQNLALAYVKYFRSDPNEAAVAFNSFLLRAKSAPQHFYLAVFVNTVATNLFSQPDLLAQLILSTQGAPNMPRMWISADYQLSFWLIALPKLIETKEWPRLKPVLENIFDQASEFYVAQGAAETNIESKHIFAIRAWRYAKFYSELAHTSKDRVRQLELELDQYDFQSLIR